MLRFMSRFKIGIWVSLAAAVLFAATPALAATGWTVARAPPTGQNGYLLGVSADSASDAWAVGTVKPGRRRSPGRSPTTGTARPGHRSPRPSYPATDPVEPGRGQRGQHHRRLGRRVHQRSPRGLHGLTTHWNGTTWTTVPAVQLRRDRELPARRGRRQPRRCVRGRRLLLARPSGYVEQWNGTSWSLTLLPDPNNGMNTSLNAISATPPPMCGRWRYELTVSTRRTSATSPTRCAGTGRPGRSWPCRPSPARTACSSTSSTRSTRSARPTSGQSATAATTLASAAAPPPP